MKYTEGQILVAIDPCRMESDGRHTLTVGRGYKISWTSSTQICIRDDEHNKHYFDLNTIHNYFHIQSENYEIF